MNENTVLLPDLKLRLHVEHPSIEECYLFGYECAQAELEEAENPFRAGTLESEHWISGWWDGFYGETPLFAAEVAETDNVLLLAAANDEECHIFRDQLFKVFEITSVIALTTLIGYQLIDLVA